MRARGRLQLPPEKKRKNKLVQDTASPQGTDIAEHKSSVTRTCLMLPGGKGDRPHLNQFEECKTSLREGPRGVEGAPRGLGPQGALAHPLLVLPGPPGSLPQTGFPLLKLVSLAIGPKGARSAPFGPIAGTGSYCLSLGSPGSLPLTLLKLVEMRPGKEEELFSVLCSDWNSRSRVSAPGDLARCCLYPLAGASS